MKIQHLLSALALTLLAPLAQAQANTASLSGWTLAGDALAQAGAITLTTAYNDELPGNLSGQSAVEIGSLETNAGVAAYGLDLSSGDYATEGSLIQQSFSVLAGQTLSFDWSFASQDTNFADHAFVVINGQVMSLASNLAPGAASQPFSFSFTSAGTVTLSLGVADTGDVLGVSTLSVSNLQLSPVPEPSTYVQLVLGLALLGATLRKRQG